MNMKANRKLAERVVRGDMLISALVEERVFHGRFNKKAVQRLKYYHGLMSFEFRYLELDIYYF